MVHIINGDIVPDDDPRVKSSAPPAKTVNPGHPKMASLATLESGRMPQQSERDPLQPSAGDSSASTLSRIGSFLFEGFLVVPAFWKFPQMRFGKIKLWLSLLFVLLFGWPALLFMLFALIWMRQ